MKKNCFWLVTVFFILLCSIFGSQREQKLLQPERHEVVVSLVLVDVIVTKDEKFVTDLTKDDFVLYEDGKIVPINSFELISFGERKLATPEEKPEKAPPSILKKQLVVIFDGISSWQRNVKESSRKIVDELISLAKLGNEVMIILLSEKRGVEVLQNFTTDEKLINKALLRASGSIWHDSSLDAIKMRQEYGIEDVGAMAEVSRYAENLLPTLEQEYLYIEKRKFEKALGGLLAVANKIKDLPGRKSILFISDGFPDITAMTQDSMITETTPTGTVSGARSPQLDIRRDAGKINVFDPFNILGKKKMLSGEEILRELIRFANAQNISIYALDPEAFTKYLVPTSAEYGPREKVTQSLEAKQKDKIGRIQNLRWISDDTGGVSLRGAQKYDNFYKVMSIDLNYYYQLSYYPPREKPDDQYHKTNVEVKRSGLDLRFRKGYVDYSEKEKKKVLLVSAFYNPSLSKDLPFEAEFVPFQKGPKNYEPWMNIALPTSQLFIEKAVEYGPKKFSLHVWVKDSKRGDKAFGGQINIPFNIDSAFLDLMSTTDFLCFYFKGPEINFSQGEYQAIFALYDDQTNEIGTWESSFSLPNPKDNRQGAIINCVLGRTTSNPRRGTQSFSLSKEDGSLGYDQIKFFPAVTNQFQQTEDASVFLQIYLPQGKDEVLPKFKVSSKGGSSQEIPGAVIAEAWDSKSETWSAMFTLDLRAVLPGDYTLKMNIPTSKEGAGLSKEVKLTKLYY